MKKTREFHIRKLDPEVMEYIRQAAFSQRVSMNTLVKTLLEDAARRQVRQ